jgi:hypothetical protein
VMASAEIPCEAQRTMPHGAEWHDGGSAGFTQFPGCFRTSIRHSLGFGIVKEVMKSKSMCVIQNCLTLWVHPNEVKVNRCAVSVPCRSILCAPIQAFSLPWSTASVRAQLSGSV